uniref:Uncharacterized protein n=1 Tax=Tetraselmis sp. GSL018 TaxID=582737 RepID=A0A061SEF7_9CHLO
MHRNVGALVARRRRPSADAGNSDMCKRCMFAVIFVFGIILTGVGVYFILTENRADVSRKKLVEPFDTAVLEWESSRRAQFERSSLKATLQYDGIGEPRASNGVAMDMAPDTKKTYLDPERDYHDDLENYQALQYLLSLPQENLTEAERGTLNEMRHRSRYLVLPQEWLSEPIPKAMPNSGPLEGQEVAVDDGSPQAGVAFSPWVESVGNLTVRVEIDSGDGSKSTHVMEGLPVAYARMTHNNFKSCRPRGGVHQPASVGNHCTIVIGLSNICLIVSRDSEGRWEFAPEKQLPCPNRCVSPCRLTHNGTAMYHGQRTAKGAQLSVLGRNSLQIEVRSEDDPFVSAYKLTGGTFQFGASKSDRHVHGIVCIVLGIILMIPAAIHFFVEYMDRRAFHALEDGPGDVSPDDVSLNIRSFVDSEPIAPLEHMQQSFGRESPSSRAPAAAKPEACQ